MPPHGRTWHRRGQMAAPGQAGRQRQRRRTVLESKASRSRPEMGLVRFRFEFLNQRDEPISNRRTGSCSAAAVPASARPGDSWLTTRRSTSARPSKARSEASSGEAGAPAFFEELSRSATATNSAASSSRPRKSSPSPAAFDPQPFHMDEAAARNSSFGRLAASGWHTGSVWMAAWSQHRKRQLATAPDRPRASAPPPVQEFALVEAGLRRRPHHLSLGSHRQARQRLAPAMGPVLPPQHRHQPAWRRGLQLRWLRLRRAQAGLTAKTGFSRS
jgi:hypothetical protein